MQKQLTLIDGHALAYRMFFALPEASFTTKNGQPTNATYGFTGKLLDLILGENPPQYLAVSFDVGATFRDEMFADYKATREKMPDSLALQIEQIKQVVEALNIPVMTLDGYEADDVLGTIAHQAKAQDVSVLIITGDRDLLQLVDENTRIQLPDRRATGSGDKIYDAQAVIDYWKVRPDQVVDYKALVGDTSDNIPGVRGVGKKTAEKLLAQYDTLDAIYADVDNIKGAMGKKIATGREMAYLSQKLARIVTDAPITLDLEACRTRDFDHAQVLAMFYELEFNSYSRRIQEDADDEFAFGAEIFGEAPQPPTEPIIVQTQTELNKLVKALNGAEVISFDLETTSLDKMQADIVGIALAVESPIGYYIPVGHLDNQTQATTGQMSLFAGNAERSEGQLPLKTVLDAIRPAMTNPTISKVAHNAKYDFTILQRHGLTVQPITFDTMIAEWLLDPSRKLGLKDMSSRRLYINMTPIEELIGKGKKQISFAEVAIEEAAPYAAADADVTLRLYHQLKTEIEEQHLDGLLALEMPLVEVLSTMEQAGIKLDVAYLQEMSVMLQARLAELEQTIHEIAGEPFNINSTQQLSDILFKKLHLPHEGVRKTKSGYFSTAVDVLEAVLDQVKESGPQDGVRIMQAILEYRELGKLQSTYVDSLPDMVNPKTGRIHTSFNQTGAITGRLASSDPNLQNIPIRTELGQKIRQAFVAEDGYMFVAADYSQVELRILAHVTQDEALLTAFREDQDIHRTTAASVYGVSVEEVTYNQRRFAKAVNFGLMYGMGAFRLARDSDLTLQEANEYIEQYFARFPGVKAYIDGTVTSAKEKGYVETLRGRRRYFHVLKDTNKATYQARLRAEREAINHPIQGTAADIIKIAMLRLHDALPKYDARLLLQVHDELLLEVAEDQVEAVTELMTDIMSDAFSLDVPLKVDASVGKNWLALKD